MQGSALGVVEAVLSGAQEAWYLLQGFKASSEARSSIVDIGSSVRCFLAPSWVLGMAALQQLTSDPAFLPVCTCCQS